jgi:4-amino-4-deoxy-L-arabinose transferase
MAKVKAVEFSHSVAGGVLLLFLIFLLYNLGGWGVMETSEARYAEISREMLESGDWLHPRLLGIQHYHKPPVTYLISAAGMGLFGVNEFGARFFLQLSFLAQAGLVYLIGLELFRDRKPAFSAMLIYLTIPAVLLSARNLTTDSYLATFELLSIWGWLRYKSLRRVGWLYLFYAALALAFQTKGPVGLIFPALVVLAYRPTATVPAKVSRSQRLLVFLFFLVLSASWYVYLMWQDRQFVNYFIINHTVNRYVSPETFHRAKPWWFYLVLVPALSLPWSAILLLQTAQLKALSRPLRILLLLWVLVPLVFFSLSSSKLIPYVLPLFAGMALLTGWVLTILPDKALLKAQTGAFIYYTLLTLSLLAIPWLPLELALPLPVLLLPVLMLASFFLISRLQDRQLGLLATAVLFTLLLIPYSTHLLGANPERFGSMRALVRELHEEKLQQRTILVYDRLLPSLAFSLRRDIVSIQDQHQSLQRELQFEKDEEWREHLLRLSHPEDLGRMRTLLSEPSVLVVKEELPAHRQWLRSNYRYSRRIGEWLIYY